MTGTGRGALFVLVWAALQIAAGSDLDEQRGSDVYGKAAVVSDEGAGGGERVDSAAAPALRSDDICDSGSRSGASSVCTVTKPHALDASSAPLAPITFEGSFVIQGSGSIAASDCDDPKQCTLVIKGTRSSSQLTMKDMGSVLGSYVNIEAGNITLQDSAWVNATHQPDYDNNRTCTLQLHSTMSKGPVTVGLYNRSRITGARINITAASGTSLWVGSDAPLPNQAPAHAAIDASGKVFSDAKGIQPAPNGAGGGYAGYGGNCDGDKAHGGEAYGPIFGSDASCLDGSPGGMGNGGWQAGSAGGQILIQAKSIILDGTITVDGAPGKMIGDTLGGGGGSGGCVHLQLSSSDDQGDQEPPIHSSPEAQAGQWCVGTACMVSANGGSGYSGGSGGRIMLNATRASLHIQPVTANHMNAVGGPNLCPPGNEKSAAQAGAAGTKFLNLRGDSAILAIDGAEQGPGELTPVSEQKHSMGVPAHRISGIYVRYYSQVQMDRSFVKTLRLKTMQLIRSQVSWTDDTSTDPSDAIDLQVHDISLTGAAQLSASPMRISCTTLSLVDRSAQIISKQDSVSINATASMDIGGQIHSSTGVNLACKGRHCRINIGQDGSVSAEPYGNGFLNITAEHIDLDGSVTGGAVSDPTSRYPVTCSDQFYENQTVNIFIAANRLNVAGTVVGGSILACPRNSKSVVNSVQIAGKVYTAGSGPGQNSGLGKGTTPQTGGHSAGGAGHGGTGGQGVWYDPTNPNLNKTEYSGGGIVYDVNATAAHPPDHVGSGGGGGDDGGGAGGGIVAITARDLILHSSQPNPKLTGYSPNIDVRGNDALVKTGGGGGSGGTVVISTQYLHGNGVIDARGGKGGSLPNPDLDSSAPIKRNGGNGGGGGGGGVVFFDWQGSDPAAAARDFVSSGRGAQAGKILLDGGKGGHSQTVETDFTPTAVATDSRFGQVRNAADGRASVYPFQPLNHNGARGALTAPNCPAGYDGCLCRACLPGRFKSNATKHEASMCSSAGPTMQELCDVCSNAPTHLRDGINYSDAVYTMFGQTNSTCPYSCRPGTILPMCLDPWSFTLSHPVLWLSVALGPVVLFGLVRTVLEFALQVDEDAATTRESSGSIDSNYSSLSTDGHLSFSEIRSRRSSNVGATLAETMRDRLGWNHWRARVSELALDSDTDGGMGWTTSAGSVSASDDGKLKAADLPYLHSRVYLHGENSPGQPWGLPKDPPETLADLVDLSKYQDLVHLVSEMVQWSAEQKFLYALLFAVCYPLACLYSRSVRHEKLKILSAYIVSAALPTLEGQEQTINRLDDIFLQTERDTGRAAERVKLGHSSDATMAYLDIVIYNQRQLSSSERTKPLLPKMVLFEGNGQWFSPFHLNTSDALVRSVVKMAPPSFASELNETIGKLGPDAIVLDTSLVDVLSVLDRAHKSPDSSVQFELRLLTVGGDRRLGLLARMKTWRENSNEQLSGDVSEELRMQRHSGQVITEDDLREMPLPARLQFLAVTLLGLRNHIWQPREDALLGARLAMICMLCLDLFFSLVAVAAAVLVPQEGYGIGEMHYPLVALFFTPGTALTVVIAPVVGCADLTFPELNLTQHQTRWNLASMLAVTVLALYIELDSNTYLPRERHPTFIWKHGYNYSLYGCILLFVVKCVRNACAVLLRAAWDSALIARSSERSSGDTVTSGGPPLLGANVSRPSKGYGSDGGTFSRDVMVPSAESLASQQRQYREQQEQSYRPRFEQRDTAPRLESFSTLGHERPSFRRSAPGPVRGVDTESLDSSLPVSGAGARSLGVRGRSESMREDSFGSMTSD